MFNEVQVNSVHYEPLCSYVYNFILKLNCVVKASYFPPQMFNITAVQAVPNSLSYSKQLTSYLGNNQLNVTQDKEYDNFPCLSYKHNSVHIQFSSFDVLSVCQMVRLNLWSTDGPSRHTN
jgi:hypothetical protein